MFTMRQIITGISLLLLAMPALVTRADSVTSALMNKQLDMQQQLAVDGPLPKVMETIADQTGIKIEAAPAVWDDLPWGQQTNVTAKIENHTLREGLTAITRQLGLQWSLGDESVRLTPMPALSRMGRRSTVGELQTLARLSGEELKLKENRPTVREILAAIDKQMEKDKSSLAVEDQVPANLREATVGVSRGSTIAEALEQLSQQSSLTWYPWGRTIIVLPKRDQVRAQLGKVVTQQYDGVEVSQVLLDLFATAGVKFTVEPAAYQLVPESFRRIHLTLDGATVQQALESISGSTGLVFEATDDGVRVWHAAIAATKP